MPKNKVVVLGGSGMLGRAIARKFLSEKWVVKTIARKEADIQLDMCNEQNKLLAILEEEKPSIIVNCAAKVSLAACEENPEQAKQINGLLVEKLVQSCGDTGAKLVQISTDHWYEGDGKKLHTEEDAIILMNEYSRSKRLGEKYALKDPSSLIIRTNITGYRGEQGRPTFVEWLISSLKRGLPITLFSDFYTCTMSCRQLSSLVIRALEQDVSGLLNVASQDCMSKLEFGYSVAKEMGVSTSCIREGSIESMKPKRGNSLGLNTEKACSVLNIEMPDHASVVNDLLNCRYI